jgi:site-specific recombinase XerD
MTEKVSTNVWNAFLATLNPRSRISYERTVKEYEEYCENHPELRKSSDECFLSFLSYLKNDKGSKPTTLWTKYSVLNSFLKNVYNI